MINIKSNREIELMTIAGKIVAEVLELMKENIYVGISTQQLDIIAERYIIKNGAFPSFKGQKGFSGASDYPATICASVNEEIIHGIPSDRILKVGDIISIDVGACYKGYHGDAARTFAVGDISEDAKKLIDVTKNSFFKGVQMAVTGNRIDDISYEIQKYAESFGYSLVREFTGHGVGKELHEEPEIPNYRTRIRGQRLSHGMALAIEPMVNQGLAAINIKSNKWTVVTADGKLSAHYENTVMVSNGEPLILTLL